MINNNSQLKSFIKAKKEDYMVLIKDACENDGKWSEAYPTQFLTFNDLMKVEGQEQGGVRDGDLAVITGISGSGKTTLAQNFTKHFVNEGLPCSWFSYEVIIDNLYAKFKDIEISDFNLINAPKKNISGEIKWIKEKIKESQEKYYTKMIFIDHIDYLVPTDIASSDQRRIILKNIAKELKEIAVELKVIIFLMAHVKKVQGREVEMQDIAESSGIYQLSDFVFSIGRYYDTKNINGRDVKVAANEGIVKLLKNRLNGQLGNISFKMENNIIKPL